MGKDKTIWSTSACKDERDHDKSENDEDLEGGQPEFELSKELDTEVVDGDDGNERDRDPDTWVDLVGWNPVPDNHGKSCQVVGRDDNVLNDISTLSFLT